MPPLPKTFTTKKQKILSSLSTISSDYADLSPKGSIDTPIIPLIQQINALDGLVTTSSCSGRISVFLEGRKGDAAVGGKGAGGRWLFVSHDPMKLDDGIDWRGPFGIGVDGPEGQYARGKGVRTVRFQFEPMILHILTASLEHAQPVLAAAINAGFRESGVQSLRNLDDADSCPMVAVRTSGLALESIIGVVEGEEGDGKEVVRAAVGREYLEMLVELANERFVANGERMERFREELRRTGAQKEDGVWEGKEERKARKRAGGLEARGKLERETESDLKGTGDVDVSIDDLFDTQDPEVDIERPQIHE